MSIQPQTVDDQIKLISVSPFSLLLMSCVNHGTQIVGFPNQVPFYIHGDKAVFTLMCGKCRYKVSRNYDVKTGSKSENDEKHKHYVESLQSMIELYVEMHKLSTQFDHDKSINTATVKHID